MVLIIGGAYQGKLQYAKEAYGLGDGDIFTCAGREIDFSKRCIYKLEEYVYACTQAGEDPRAYLEENKEKWADSVILCRDIFCGVVPMEADQRAWRQETGRLCQYLSKEADSVIRIFCGLEQRLK